jgi:hypothetical protein
MDRYSFHLYDVEHFAEHDNSVDYHDTPPSFTTMLANFQLNAINNDKIVYESLAKFKNYDVNSHQITKIKTPSCSELKTEDKIVADLSVGMKALETDANVHEIFCLNNPDDLEWLEENASVAFPIGYSGEQIAINEDSFGVETLKVFRRMIKPLIKVSDDGFVFVGKNLDYYNDVLLKRIKDIQLGVRAMTFPCTPSISKRISQSGGYKDYLRYGYSAGLFERTSSTCFSSIMEYLEMDGIGLEEWYILLNESRYDEGFLERMMFYEPDIALVIISTGMTPYLVSLDDVLKLDIVEHSRDRLFDKAFTPAFEDFLWYNRLPIFLNVMLYVDASYLPLSYRLIYFFDKPSFIRKVRHVIDTILMMICSRRDPWMVYAQIMRIGIGLCDVNVINQIRWPIDTDFFVPNVSIFIVPEGYICDEKLLSYGEMRRISRLCGSFTGHLNYSFPGVRDTSKAMRMNRVANSFNVGNDIYLENGLTVGLPSGSYVNKNIPCGYRIPLMFLAYVEGKGWNPSVWKYHSDLGAGSSGSHFEVLLKLFRMNGSIVDYGSIMLFLSKTTRNYYLKYAKENFKPHAVFTKQEYHKHWMHVGVDHYFL